MSKVLFKTESARVIRKAVLIITPLALLLTAAPVSAAPLIALSPESGAVGTEVTVTGTNFESYRGDTLHVFFDSDEAANSPFTMPDEGTFAFSFMVPAGFAPGEHHIRIRSGAGTELAAAIFLIDGVHMQLDTSRGSAGARIEVAGRGFYAGQDITFNFVNRITQKLGTATASETGTFVFDFIIPESTAGAHTLTAGNSMGNQFTADFTVLPAMTSSLSSAAPGEELNVSGTGFGYKQQFVILFRDTDVLSGTTDQYGSFSADLRVPDFKAGLYDIRVIDGQGNTDEARFTVTAGASLDASMGAVGAQLKVTGSGFIPGGTLAIQYDDAEVLSLEADNAGEFTGSFYVPLSKSGQHLITVTDGVNTRQLGFTVESTPPPLPRPLLPANNTGTRAAAYLDWNDVTDPSQPVVYRLQVASDMNFSSIVLDRENVLASEYKLAGEETLSADEPRTYYYWRVQAIDGASNESGWSPPWSFYVSPPPTPEPLLPLAASKAKSQAEFEWAGVTNLSPPIAYTLQIANDPQFAAIVFEKEGIEEPRYTLAEEERLAAVKADVPYYWRVKAVDSAGNDSNWSEALSFHVGLAIGFPSWALALLGVIGVILLGLAAFWLGRRTSFPAGNRYP